MLYFPSLTNFHQNGNTALIWAARGGHFEVTKFLLDAGAAMEATDGVS